MLFDFVELLYQGQAAMRFAFLFVFTLCFHGFAKFSTRVCPAANMFQLAHDDDRIIAIISIGLQIALEALKQSFGDSLRTTGIVIK